MAAAPLPVVEELIRTTGFFRNKARALCGMATALERDHGGTVPRSLEALVQLPGVARKTANVVLGIGFGIAAGVVVDTHVTRLARRLGLTAQTDPKRIEVDLMAYVPRREWIDFSNRLILHGRGLCGARRPRCGECLLAPHCPAASP